MNILDKRIVYDESGAPVSLAGLLKSGGDGEIFSIDGSHDYCAKIVYEKCITATLFQKITAMVANPPNAGLIDCRETHGPVVLAWPVSVLFDSPLGSRNFIGFTMALVDTDLFREVHLYYDRQDRIREFGGAFSWRYLLTAAYNIATVTDDIHQHKHCVADFSGRNILIARTAAVAVIDCDSFQIHDRASGRVFPSVAGTGEYLPPELQGHNFAKERPDRYFSDLFGLAVMVFKLLMGGVHPFQAGGEGLSVSPGIEQNIQNGVFALASPDGEIYDPSFAPDYHILPPSLCHLFSRCFVDGISEPKRRPSAGEWKDCLLSEIMAMKHCRVNANHWFGGHLAACPWCSRDDQDIFPAERPFSPRKVPVEVEAISPEDENMPSSASPEEECVSSSVTSSSLSSPTSVPEYDGVAVDASVISPAIYLPEPHVAMHDVARGITIPCSLPVTVTGDCPLLIHLTSDVPWIEIADATVSIEGEGVVHVTLNTGNMSSKGFQNGRVILSAGDIREEIFLFVSILPEF